ncbi:hypothetical protein [Nonlabens sp. Asnod3-A02]|uniref:hypothetical protein n=1 Tax=Nonlabens sp. Asnod3-A02 TaxID=3160579 RepID=UPI0038657D03
MNRLARLSKNKQMLYIAMIFIVLNIITIFFFELIEFRLVRLLSSITALLYFHFYISYKNRIIYSIFIMLVCSDVSMVFYEHYLGLITYTLWSIAIYLTLSISALRKIQWRRVTSLDYIVFILVFLFNIYILEFTVSDIRELFETRLAYYLIKMTGYTGLISCLLSAFLNATRLSFRTAYFMYALFGLIFSDFVAMLAFYYKIEPKLFFLIDRAAYLFALFFLVRHAYMAYLQKEAAKAVAILKKSSQDSISL